MNKYNSNSISTYSDFSKGPGIIYKQVCFKELSLIKLNYMWCNYKTNELFSRYQTQIKNETVLDNDF